MHTVWSSAVELLPGTVRTFDFGSLRVWVRRTRTTWQYASNYVGGGGGVLLRSNTPQYSGRPVPQDSAEPAEGVDWTTFIPRDNQLKLFFQPGPPDRPVVVRGEQPFELSPGARYRLFAALPLRVRAWLGGIGNQLLFELPTEAFSNTWFGGPMTGRLCYSSPGVFGRESSMVVENLRVNQAVCPMLILNNADHLLRFTRIVILADLLRIYRTIAKPIPSAGKKSRGAKRNSAFSTLSSPEGVLWTSQAIGTYASDEELHVSVDENPPVIDCGTEELASPDPAKMDNLLKRSMILLRRISNYE